MSRKDLSSHSKISERYLAQLESGRANPSAEILWRIAEAMGTEFGSILSPRAPDGAAHVDLVALVASLDSAEQSEAYELLRKRCDPPWGSRRGIALIGLRGAGKTTLGRLLAERCGWPFVRLGDWIVRLGGMETEELFSLGGQKA